MTLSAEPFDIKWTTVVEMVCLDSYPRHTIAPFTLFRFDESSIPNGIADSIVRCRLERICPPAFGCTCNRVSPSFRIIPESMSVVCLVVGMAAAPIRYDISLCALDALIQPPITHSGMTVEQCECLRLTALETALCVYHGSSSSDSAAGSGLASAFAPFDPSLRPPSICISRALISVVYFVLPSRSS